MRWTPAALAVCALTAAAGAAPLATLRDDVDGDGAPDQIELDSDGAVRIAQRTIRVASQPSRGKLAVARGPAGVQLVVDVTSAAGREAVVLDGRAGWREVTRFALGGVGLDREYDVEVDATPLGVIRYHSRPDVVRCDGKPAYLFGERLDGGTFRQLDPVPTGVGAVPALAARLDPSAAAAPLLYQARAASHQPGASDAGALAIPRELDDGKPSTGWREVLASGGEGQFFTFHPRVPSARAHQLRVVPGNPASPATMRAFGRPRGLIVVAAGGAWRTELPDAAGEPLGAAYVVDLPQPVAGCVTVILDTTWGRPQAATAIAELEVFGEGERAGGGEALFARLVADGRDGATTAAAALARRGAAGVTALDGELARTGDPGARRRLVAALVKIDDPATAPALVRAAAAGWVRDRDLIDLIGALARLGQTQALRDLAANRALPVDSRVAAAARLDGAGDGPRAGFDALIGLAGAGPPALRRQLIEQLARAPVVKLVQAASTHGEPAAAGDLWRATTRRARGVPADRPAAAAAMVAALATATDYERRYRLIDGVASHGDEPALATLAALLRGLPAGAEAAALRQVAIRGAASAPRPAAIALVVALARDGDPGVRMAALSALAGADGDAAGGPAEVERIDGVLGYGLAADGWPEVRRRAASALGVRCQRPGPARALADAVAGDPELAVRADALTALVQCNAAGVRELLARTWDDAGAPLPLRTRAVDLVVALGDRQLAAALIGKLRRWRGEAIESVAALALAQSAAATIGRLAPPGAAAALLDALDDTAYPELVAAAALALGALGPACPPAARAKLNALARSDERSAFVARRAAAQCGR